MAENVENAITPTVLIGATAVAPGSDVGTVDAATARQLLNVANGATANSTDATLKDRTNHTGSQAISTITGLQTALNGKVDSVFTRSGAVVAATGDYNADQVSETANNKILTLAERTKLQGVATGATANASDALLRDRTTHTGTQAESTITNLVTDLAAKAPLASPALTGTPTAPTPATSDNTGRIATTAFTQALLSTVSGGTRYLGNWNASTNTPTLSNGSGISVPGGFYVVSVAGSTTIDGISSWTVGDWIISDNIGWKKIDQSDSVASVFGRTGSVVASTGDYNAGQVTETATGKIMTDLERTKLAGVATGATVNATDAALRDRTTHTGAQAISTVTGLQTSLDGKVTTVFGRAGPAVVQVSGDYNADQVTETATGKILTATERTKLAGIEVGATADQTAAEIETAYNAQVAVVTQAIAEAGTSTTVARWTPERVKQAIVALAPLPGGASGSNLNSNVNVGTPAVALSTTEAQIGSVAITPSVTSARILVIAAVYLTKDTGATARTATIRMRRGTSNANPQVGGDLVALSQPLTGTLFGPVTLAYIDTAPSTAAITYTVRGLVAVGASTANAFHMAAVELTGLSISTLPTITGATDPAADYVVVYDASTGTNVKVLLSSLGIGGGALTDGDKGDVTITSGIWNIDPNTVTYAKMQDISATDRLLGRQTAGAGDPEEIVCTAAGRALLDDASNTVQRTTLGLGTAAVADTTAFQATDATLTALAGLNATAGLVEQTGTDVFTKRAMGVAASTDVLTRADGDARFASAVHTHAQSAITNLTTDLATINSAVALKAPLAAPALTGVPTAPTAASTTNTTQLATTAFVQQELGSAANFGFKTIASPSFANVDADAQADTLNLVAGSNITLTSTPASDTITIAASGSIGTDSEAVSFLFPATGAATRTVESKLADIIDIRDFGAPMNGTGDDTPALQEAIDYAELTFRGIGRSVIDITGIALINYAALVPPTVPVTLRVNGMIQVTSCFKVTRNLSIIGIGGYNNLAQFLIGPYCIIEPHSSLGVDHTVQVLEYGYMEGVHVIGNRAGKAAIHIGRRSTDPRGDVGEAQSSLIHLKRIGADAQSGATAAIRIEHTFWLWIQYFHVGNQNGPSIWIADSYDPMPNSNHSGLVDIRDGCMAYGGIQFGDPATGYTSAIGYHYWFTNIHYESCTTPFFKFHGYATASDVFINKCNVADNISSDCFIDNTHGSNVLGVRFEETNHMYGLRAWKGRPALDMFIMDGFFPFIAEANFDLFSDLSAKVTLNLQGEVEACDGFRGGDFAPQMLPAGAVHILPSQDPSTWTPNGPGFTFTAGQTAPDGSATAYRIQTSSTGNSLDLTLDQTALTDHWLLYGVWARAPNQANRIVPGQATPLLRIVAAGAATGGYWDDDPLQTNNTQEIGNKFIHAMNIKAGWVLFSDMHAYKANSTGPSPFYFSIIPGPNSGDVLVWRPFCLRLPRPQFSARDARRILSNLSLVDIAAKPGTLSQLPHHTFRTGIGATAARPSASTVGAGAQWFDTTLNQPIWSNGTAWATATGSAPAIVSSINGQIETVAIKTYTLDQKAAALYTINSLTTKTGAGSCTATLRIDGTAVTFTGGGTSHTTTETEYTATAANSVAAGQTVTLVVTAISAATDLVFTMKTTS